MITQEHKDPQQMSFSLFPKVTTKTFVEVF